MHKILISPYKKIFYIRWKLLSTRSDHNIVFDQELNGRLNVLEFRDAIKRFILNNIVLNCHVEDINGQLYWRKNTNYSELEYLENNQTNEEILSYIQEPFDLENKPLYRFR